MHNEDSWKDCKHSAYNPEKNKLVHVCVWCKAFRLLDHNLNPGIWRAPSERMESEDDDFGQALFMPRPEKLRVRVPFMFNLEVNLAKGREFKDSQQVELEFTTMAPLIDVKLRLTFGVIPYAQNIEYVSMGNTMLFMAGVCPISPEDLSFLGPFRWQPCYRLRIGFRIDPKASEFYPGSLLVSGETVRDVV